MSSVPRLLAAAAIVLAVLAFPPTAGAQAVLQQVRDLYAAAAYEDALAVLARSGDQVPRNPELGLYRVSCLAALNRQDDAARAIEEIVRANPLYRPGNADAAPRILEMFRETREHILPDVTREIFSNAKTALERKDRAASIAGFERVLTIIDAGGDAREGTLAEMRFLAAGFLDLSRALPEPEPPAPAPSAPATVEAAPAPAQAGLVPPQPINQVLPPWQPPNEASRRAEFRGAVRVLISASGKVESAEILQHVHPAYDPMLLFAARTWLYKPATRNGVPVPSEKIVQVELRPR